MIIFTPNSVIKSADVNLNNADLADITNWSNPYKFKATTVRTTTLTSTAYTLIHYDTEVFDTNNNFEAVTAHAYTIPVNGYYQFYASVGAIAGATGGRHGCLIYVDDALTYWGNLAYTAASVSSVRTATAFDYFTAGQVITVREYVDGSNATCTADVSTNHFSGFLVSAT